MLDLRIRVCFLDCADGHCYEPTFWLWHRIKCVKKGPIINSEKEYSKGLTRYGEEQEIMIIRAEMKRTMMLLAEVLHKQA
jgi:hypothetical protein